MVEENLQQQWILEFLLRQPVEDSLISRLISSFSPTNWNHRIMTRLLLRRASSMIQKDHTSEQTDYSIKRVLGTLEMIIAINQFNPRFINLMERAKSEVEMVVNDASGCEDTRKLAFDSVRNFLIEATEELGLSYLESVVKTMCEEVRDNEVAGTVEDNQVNQAEVGKEGAGDPLDDNNPSTSKTDVGCSEQNPSVTTKSNSVLAPEFRRIIDKGKEICQEMAPSTSKPAEKANEKVDEAHFPANVSIDDQECSIDVAGENLEANGGKLSAAGENLEGNDNSDLLRKKSYGVSTPEFQKVKEALKSSVLELKAVVKDPLPDALHMAANISANVATEGVSNEQLAENENEVDMDMQDHTALKECVNVQAKDGNNRCSAADSRPSLMERNSTARTFEWEDEVESSRGSSERPCLPPFRRRTISPLRKKERINIIGRRRAKRWSALEEEVLRDAVKEYGRGKWQLILDNYGEIFEERTAVDLKDKWRNMTR